MKLAIFLTICYALTVGIGMLLSRMRVPWMFAALLVGVGFAFWNPFPEIGESTELAFMAEVGMYFYLFVVGFEMNLREMFKEGKFIVIMAVTLFVVETAVGSLFIHFVFGTPWMTAVIVGFTFATVGEALLIPIFREFGVLDTKLGQMVLGIAFIDNLFEVLAVVLVAVLLLTGGMAGAPGSGGPDGSPDSSSQQLQASTEGGSSTEASSGSGNQAPKKHDRIFGRDPEKLNLWGALGAVVGLFLLTWLLRRIPDQDFKTLLEKVKLTHVVEILFSVILIVLFGFLALGTFAEAAALGALLAGLAVKPLIPQEEQLREELIEDVRTVAYGVFGVPFFISVGLHTNVDYLMQNILIVVALILVVKAAKILPSLIGGWKKLGPKASLAMGVSLAVKFSTSIVLVKLLYDTGQIDRDLYSVLIAAKILFKFLVPFLLAWMFTNWKDVMDPDSGGAETAEAS